MSTSKQNLQLKNIETALFCSHYCVHLIQHRLEMIYRAIEERKLILILAFICNNLDTEQTQILKTIGYNGKKVT